MDHNVGMSRCCLQRCHIVTPGCIKSQNNPRKQDPEPEWEAGDIHQNQPMTCKFTEELLPALQGCNRQGALGSRGKLVPVLTSSNLHAVNER